MYLVIAENKTVRTCDSYKKAYCTMVWLRSIANRKDVIIVKDGKVLRGQKNG